MRIAILTNDLHPSRGGPPRVVLGHALELSRRGLSPEVFATFGPGEEDATRSGWPELTQAEIPLHLFPRTGYGPLGRSPALSAHFAKHIADFDVLHLHGTWEQCVASAASHAHRASVPYAVSPHGMLDRYSRSQSRLKKWVAWNLFGTGRMLKQANGAMFGTQEEQDEASDLGLHYQPFIIPNGIHLDEFSRTVGEGIEELHVSFPTLRGKHPLLLFYSRMHPKKGIDLLLEGFARVRSEFPDAGLLIAALAQDPDYEVRMRARANESDLKEQVVITTEYTGARGFIPINAADAFVLTSHQEGFSMAILEAMAYELPVLITHPCHMDEVGDAGAGEVVEASIPGVEEGLRRLLRRSPEERSNMGEKGRHWVEDHCTWERIAEQLESMYEALIRGRKTSP